MKIQHPHNNLFEKVMELKSAAYGLISYFLPDNIVAELDLSTLKQEGKSFITEELASLYSDIIYSCNWKGKKAYLSFLFEHKSNYELPDLQLMTYAIQGYKKQKSQWQIKQKHHKKKQEKYIPKLILPILLYHGVEKWQDKTFADLFDLPNDDFKDFIPSINYLLIDLKQYPDHELETIEMKILFGMLLLFKHKGDKEYVLKNIQKIFIFVEEEVARNITELYVKLFVLYIFQTFKLEKEEVVEIIPELPKPVKKEFMTTYDILIKEGYQKGSADGEIKGEIKTKLETLVELMIKFPMWSNELLSEISKLPASSIIALKKGFAGRSRKNLMKETRKLFAEIPNLREKHWEEIDKLTIRLWKRFQKALKNR